MKSLLIIVLFFALMAAAFFTKPSQQDFQSFIVQRQTAGDTNMLKKAIDEEMAKSVAKNATFKNRILWVDVQQQDGTTIYTGAFSHWFNRADVKNDVQKVEQQSHDKLTKIEQTLQK